MSGSAPTPAGTLRPTWTPPARGALFVVSGASGTGKTTLLRAALEQLPGLEFSVSVTTRTMRPGEEHGRDYWFISPQEYSERVARGDLLEHAGVYDRAYGTPRAPVEAALAQGRSIVLDIDVQGARQVRARMPEAVSVFILPPSVASMEARLRARGDADDVIRRRMAQCTEQLAGAREYDYLVLNDDLAAAHAQFQAVLVAELLRRERRMAWVERL
ncbi:MAG: guanylate kinase [Deltaproteobacteria bacterium]|nr:guanylate kinase [Deltaproteobacteria bacterium]